MSTIRRVALWAVVSAALTTALVLGGWVALDRYVTQPRTDRLQVAVDETKANGVAIADAEAKACAFYVATADALVSLAHSPDLSEGQLTALARMQTVARDCRQASSG